MHDPMVTDKGKRKQVFMRAATALGLFFSLGKFDGKLSDNAYHTMFKKNRYNGRQARARGKAKRKAKLQILRQAEVKQIHNQRKAKHNKHYNKIRNQKVA